MKTAGKSDKTSQATAESAVRIQGKSTQRNTHQRWVISECVNHLHHPTADEIWHCVLKDMPSVSKTTVYRNLNRMVEEGQIRRFLTGEGIARFDHVTAHHYHICCEKCGAICDVEMNNLKEIEARVPAQTGYKITGHDVLFSGICPACRERDQS